MHLPSSSCVDNVDAPVLTKTSTRWWLCLRPWPGKIFVCSFVLHFGFVSSCTKSSDVVAWQLTWCDDYIPSYLVVCQAWYWRPDKHCGDKRRDNSSMPAGTNDMPASGGCVVDGLVYSYRIYAHHSCTTSPLRTAKKYALQLKSLVLFVVVMLLLFLQPWLRICRRNHWRFSKAPCCRCNPFPHHHQTSTRHTHTVAPTVLSLCLYLLHPTHVASSGCCFWRIQMLSRHLYCFRVMTNLTKYCHCQSCFYSLSFFLNSFHQICYIACVQLELVDNLRAIADVVIESKFTLSVLFVAHLFWPVWPPNAQARMAIPSTLHHLMDAGIWMCIMNPLVCPSFEKLILPTGRKRLSPLTNSW